MQHVLVTGGAGYIGAHACKALKAAGFVPVAFDNLNTGWRDAVKFGPFVFHLQRGELRLDDEHIRITEREREMLRVLASGLGETLPREALAEHGTASNERTIDVQINRLRRKIEVDPGNPLYLQTVRGIGYKLVIDR